MFAIGNSVDSRKYGRGEVCDILEIGSWFSNKPKRLVCVQFPRGGTETYTMDGYSTAMFSSDYIILLHPPVVDESKPFMSYVWQP